MASGGPLGPRDDCTLRRENAASSIGTNRACALGSRRPGGLAGCPAYTRAVSEAHASGRSIPETRPTPLPRDWFVYLSVVAFLAGAVAITALEFGVSLGSPLVKACMLVGSPPLAIALADATVRIWRSAWAWMPVDRAKGIFRLAWLGAPAVGFAGIAVALVAVFGT